MSDGGLVQVWDTATGKELRKLNLKMGRVCQITLSKDGAVVAVSVETDKDGVEDVCLWREGKAEIAQQFRVSDRVYSLLLDGKRLWVGGRQGIYCWDVETNLRIVEHKFAKPDRVWSMAVSLKACAEDSWCSRYELGSSSPR